MSSASFLNLVVIPDKTEQQGTNTDLTKFNHSYLDNKVSINVSDVKGNSSTTGQNIGEVYIGPTYTNESYNMNNSAMDPINTAIDDFSTFIQRYYDFLSVFSCEKREHYMDPNYYRNACNHLKDHRSTNSYNATYHLFHLFLSISKSETFGRSPTDNSVKQHPRGVYYQPDLSDNLMTNGHELNRMMSVFGKDVFARVDFDQFNAGILIPPNNARTNTISAKYKNNIKFQPTSTPLDNVSLVFNPARAFVYCLYFFMTKNGPLTNDPRYNLSLAFVANYALFFTHDKNVGGQYGRWTINDYNVRFLLDTKPSTTVCFALNDALAKACKVDVDNPNDFFPAFSPSPFSRFTADNTQYSNYSDFYFLMGHSTVYTKRSRAGANKRGYRKVYYSSRQKNIPGIGWICKSVFDKTLHLSTNYASPSKRNTKKLMHAALDSNAKAHNKIDKTNTGLEVNNDVLFPLYYLIHHVGIGWGIVSKTHNNGIPCANYHVTFITKAKKSKSFDRKRGRKNS